MRFLLFLWTHRSPDKRVPGNVCPSHMRDDLDSHLLHGEHYWPNLCYAVKTEVWPAPPLLSVGFFFNLLAPCLCLLILSLYQLILKQSFTKLQNGENSYRVLTVKARRQYGFLFFSVQQETFNAFSFSLTEDWTQSGKNCVLLILNLLIMRSTCFIWCKSSL